MLMCGDWWQLPPVRSIAIFSNPFQDSQFGEQAILNMFWKRNVDSLQGMHELTQQMRCKDQWWRCVLDEDRHGQAGRRIALFTASQRETLDRG